MFEVGEVLTGGQMRSITGGLKQRDSKEWEYRAPDPASGVLLFSPTHQKSPCESLNFYILTNSLISTY